MYHIYVTFTPRDVMISVKRRRMTTTTRMRRPRSRSILVRKKGLFGLKDGIPGSRDTPFTP